MRVQVLVQVTRGEREIKSVRRSSAARHEPFAFCCAKRLALTQEKSAFFFLSARAKTFPVKTRRPTHLDSSLALLALFWPTCAVRVLLLSKRPASPAAFLGGFIRLVKYVLFFCRCLLWLLELVWRVIRALRNEFARQVSLLKAEKEHERERESCVLWRQANNE